MNQEAPSAVVGISYAGKPLPANCTALSQALLARLSDADVALASGSRGYALVDREAVPGRFAVAVCADIPALAVSGSQRGVKGETRRPTGSIDPRDVWRGLLGKPRSSRRESTSLSSLRRRSNSAA